MKKKLIVIFTLLFIFILSSCEKKDNVGEISLIPVENIKNEMEFEDGIKSYVYISETSRRVYYYFGLKDGFKVVIDDSFLSERILYEQKKDETKDEYLYNSSKLESPDKIYDYNFETKELSLSINNNREIISNDINYDKDSILDYLSIENGDELVNPNFVIESILNDMSKHSYLIKKSKVDIYNNRMTHYEYYLKQYEMSGEDSDYYKVMREKYLSEKEYEIFTKFINENVLSNFGSPGCFDCFVGVDNDLKEIYPCFLMEYFSSYNEILDSNEIYFFNVSILDKYVLLFSN